MAVDVLQAKIRKLKNPTMVCICPTIRELPLHIKKEARHKYGQTLRAAADAYRTFSFGILDALKETVPAVSIVSGAFSALGADGVAAMQEVLAYAQSLGYYVLLDLMRADLGTTAQDQADACFGSIQGRRGELYALSLRRRSHERLSGQRRGQALCRLLPDREKRLHHFQKLQQICPRGAGSALRRPRGLSGDGRPCDAVEHRAFRRERLLGNRHCGRRDEPTGAGDAAAEI